MGEFISHLNSQISSNYQILWIANSLLNSKYSFLLKNNFFLLLAFVNLSNGKKWKNKIWYYFKLINSI